MRNWEIGIKKKVIYEVGIVLYIFKFIIWWEDEEGL